MKELNGKQAKVKSIVKNIAKKGAPLLSTWRSCRQSAQRSLKSALMRHYRWRRICMKKMLTTYPRTDARVLSSAVAKEIGKKYKQA